MADKPETVETTGEVEVSPSTIDYAQIPGCHVVLADGTLIGTYATEAEAQAFYDGQLKPQDITAQLVKGPAIA